LVETLQAVKSLRDEGLAPGEEEGDFDESNTRQFKAPMDGDINEYITFQESLSGMIFHCASSCLSL
jgi:hypothetical protein